MKTTYILYLDLAHPRLIGPFRSKAAAQRWQAEQHEKGIFHRFEWVYPVDPAEWRKRDH